MNWSPVFLFISLYSLCSGGVIQQTRTVAADNGDNDSMLGSIIIEQMLGIDSLGLDADSYQAFNTADRFRIISEYIYEIFVEEDEAFLKECEKLLDSEDFAERFRALGEAGKTLERIVTGSVLMTALMEDPRFVEQHAKAALTNFIHSESSCNGPVPDIGKVNGFYGNPAKLNLQAEVQATYNIAKINAKVNIIPLVMLDHGIRGTPDPESRLGAYYTTRDYKTGSVGNAVHRMIGGMYLFLGSAGEEKIGRIYNDQVVKALLNQPIESNAIRCLASIEDLYYKNVQKENPESAGGFLGTVITSRTRECLTLLISGIFCS